MASSSSIQLTLDLRHQSSLSCSKVSLIFFFQNQSRKGMGNPKAFFEFPTIGFSISFFFSQKYISKFFFFSNRNFILHHHLTLKLVNCSLSSRRRIFAVFSSVPDSATFKTNGGETFVLDHIFPFAHPDVRGKWSIQIDLDTNASKIRPYAHSREHIHTNQRSYLIGSLPNDSWNIILRRKLWHAGYNWELAFSGLKFGSHLLTKRNL